MVYTYWGAWGTRADELMKQVPISHIEGLLELPGDALIRLYSYQSKEAWDAAVQRGYWTGNDNLKDLDDRGFTLAYDWMREQMAVHIPGFSGDYPMWAWYKRPSTKPKETQYTGTSGGVRLTVLVPRSRILISDFDTWHSVLNQGLLCREETEWNAYCASFPQHYSEGTLEYQAAHRAFIEPSWQGCFEFIPATTAEELSWGGSKKYFRLQACVDRFHWSEVVAHRFFEVDKYKRE